MVTVVYALKKFPAELDLLIVPQQWVSSIVDQFHNITILNRTFGVITSDELSAEGREG